MYCVLFVCLRACIVFVLFDCVRVWFVGFGGGVVVDGADVDVVVVVVVESDPVVGVVVDDVGVDAVD